MTQQAAEGSMFLIIDHEGWHEAPVPGSDPRGVGLDGVLRHLADCPDEWRGEAAGVAPRARATVELTVDDCVERVWAAVGRVYRGFLLFEDLHGGAALLDEIDCRLLDALSPGLALGDIAVAGVGTAELVGRAGRLLAAGIVRRGEVAAAEPAPVAPVALRELGAYQHRIIAVQEYSERAGHALRSSSKLRRLRSLGRRNGHGPASPSAADAGAETAEVASGAAPSPELETDAPVDPRIPIYAVWHENVGPLLSLGMLTATARVWNDGALHEHFEIRRPETAESVLADLEGRPGPAVLLCSDYVWSIDANLELAARAKALNPELIILHGGPSSPKYEPDAEQFFVDHAEVTDILVRGEGEHVFCEVLDTIAAAGGLDPDRLASIGSLTFRGADGTLVRTEDYPRIKDLDVLPSPYLTGEFDHISPAAWTYCIPVETNRGCPYGCTFCDWGSSTLSRIRKFDLDRVTREIEWAASKGVETLNVTDANFGIMSRDIETATRVADIRRRTGFPQLISYYPAKNTTKHLSKIMDILLDAGVGPTASLSLQTSDPTTLEAIERHNISTDHYVALAAEYRRRGFPLQGDLLLGLPGQTYESYRNDLQFNIDHEIQARTWQVRILPNAPMNAPEYRERFEIVSDDSYRIMSTNTFSEADRRKMLRLRNMEIIGERFGVFRHIMRWLQWDHGVPATMLLDRVLDVTTETPTRYPLISWLVEYFDLYPTAPVGWGVFYDEVRTFVMEQFDVPASSALDTVIGLQRFLMPRPGRTFPAEIQLPHDYVSYYREATRSLYTRGESGTPSRPLEEFGPVPFVVTSDPVQLCEFGPQLAGDPRDELIEGDFLIGSNSSYELMSALLRQHPFLSAQGIEPPVPTLTAEELEDIATLVPEKKNIPDAVRVTLGSAGD